MENNGSCLVLFEKNDDTALNERGTWCLATVDTAKPMSWYEYSILVFISQIQFEQDK